MPKGKARGKAKARNAAPDPAGNGAGATSSSPGAGNPPAGISGSLLALHRLDRSMVVSSATGAVLSTGGAAAQATVYEGAGYTENVAALAARGVPHMPRSTGQSTNEAPPQAQVPYSRENTGQPSPHRQAGITTYFSMGTPSGGEIAIANFRPREG